MHRQLQQEARKAARRGIVLPILLPGLVGAQTPTGIEASLLAQQQLSGWLAGMLAMMALTVGVLALRHARERHALYLAGMMLAWLLLRTSQATANAWLTTLLAMALLVLGGVQFLMQQGGTPRGWVTSALSLQCFLAPASLLLLGPQALPLLMSLWSGLLVLELVAAMLWNLRQRWLALQPPAVPDTWLQQDFKLMRGLLGTTSVALLSEQLARISGVPALQAAAPWLGLALPLLMLALGLVLILAIVRARDEAESRHAEVEQRMHERVAEVERNFSTMAELKLEQVTERERKRIAADLHDDLGAKLLTIVHTSESDRISPLAREALEEMRLSVRGLTGKPVQLLDALGDWRSEVVSRLGQANILAEWKSPAEDIVHTLQARAYVQTTRIFREAVSNIIKHSGATHCAISCNVQDGDFLVVIQDNGQGIPAELDGRLDRGHGMASMKSRAKQMHGQCLVESGPGWGTVIRLTIPL